MIVLPVEETARWLVDRLLEASWQASVLIVVVLLIQRLTRRRLSAAWRSRLWVLVAIRLALPVVPASAVSVYNLLPVGPRQSEASLRILDGSVRVGERAVGGLSGARRERPLAPMSARWRVDWRLPALLIWAMGAAFTAALTLRVQVRFRRRIAQDSPSIDPVIISLLERCSREMGVRRAVTIICTDAIQSPAITGLVHPKLLLPNKLAGTLDSSELRFIFLHELAHLRCMDMLLDWLVALLRTLHWFNPVVWLAAGRYRVDRELARDAMVLRAGPQADEPHYGRTILKLVEQLGYPKTAPGVLVLLDESAPLERRIRMIAGFQRNMSGGSALAIGLMLVVGCTALTGREENASNIANTPAGAHATTLPAVRVDHGIPDHAVKIEMDLVNAEQDFLDETLRPIIGQARLNQSNPAAAPATGQPTRMILLNPEEARKVIQAAVHSSRASVKSAPRLLINEGQRGTIITGKDPTEIDPSTQSKTPVTGMRIDFCPAIGSGGKQVVLDVDSAITTPRKPDRPSGEGLDVWKLKFRVDVESGWTMLCTGLDGPNVNSPDGREMILLLKPEIPSK